MPENLEKLDAKILNFVGQQDIVSIKDISDHIKTDSNVRINFLVKQKYLTREIERFEEIKSNFVGGVLPVYSGKVRLTDSGKLAIQNYHENKKSDTIKYVMNNWIAFLALAIAAISLIRTF